MEIKNVLSNVTLSRNMSSANTNVSKDTINKDVTMDEKILEYDEDEQTTTPKEISPQEEKELW